MSKKVKTGILAAMMLPMAVLAKDKKSLTGGGEQTNPTSSKHVHHSKKGAHSAKGLHSKKATSTSKELHSGKGAVTSKGPVKIQYGVASYYANKFEGRKTYTDEIFRQAKLTGASNTLPMGTWVKVTNLRNHREVYVRINDKMHPKNRRLIDLSHAAAKQLGYAGRGLTHVRIDVLGKKRPEEAKDEIAEVEPSETPVNGAATGGAATQSAGIAAPSTVVKQ